MKAVLLLATAAIALPFLISGLASDHRAVADRFLERAFPGPPTLPTNDAQRPEVVDANKLRA
jgi:cell division septation protein DedD